MTTMADIQVAIEQLTLGEQDELLSFMLALRRGWQTSHPPVRLFSPEEIEAWVRQDEEDMARLRREWGEAARD